MNKLFCDHETEYVSKFYTFLRGFDSTESEGSISITVMAGTRMLVLYPVQDSPMLISPHGIDDLTGCPNYEFKMKEE